MIGIYKITNILNNKSYIGQSVNLERRKNEHFSGNTKQYIDEEIALVGKEYFTFEILEYCTQDKLNELEQYWINYYDSFYNGYNKTKGGEYQYCGRPIITKEDVIEIRIAYKNHERRKDVYLKYKDKLSEGGFNHIWDGTTWRYIMPEIYTEENKKMSRQNGQRGENNGQALLSDEEVIHIRERYVNETASQIWQDYSDKYTLGSFKQILIGVKYSHLPIYKKVEKRWINNDK